MQDRQRMQQPGGDMGARMVAELIQATGRALGLSVEVFLHNHFGRRYVGCGALGVFVIIFFGFLFPGQDVRGLFAFLLVYIVFWLMACLEVLIRCWRGKDATHSHYNGYPYLFRKVLRGWNEINVKYAESVVLILFGCFACPLSFPFGVYLIVASFFALVRNYNIASEQRTRAIDLNDAVIEQQLVAEQFRDMQGR